MINHKIFCKSGPWSLAPVVTSSPWRRFEDGTCSSLIILPTSATCYCVPSDADVFGHPPPRLASRHPIWSDVTSVDTITQWREDWSSASVLNHTILPTLLSDSQVSISLIIHGPRWTVSGQVKAHVVLTCTNGVSPNHLLVIVVDDRPWTTLSTHAH